MDFRDTPPQAAFRAEVRQFLRDEFSGELEPGAAGMAAWRKKLVARGWVAPAWPKEYGGAALGVMDQFILNEEFAEARAPQVGGLGVAMAGPTLIVHGTEEQKQQHLPRILNGEVIWCQGFSEPGAGSDLASLQTRAVRDGDDYVVNGQKIWTSMAQHAHWMFMLTRTDPAAPKHRGITYLLVDMKSPGITVRPLYNMADRHDFNEVFFDNVRVPAANRVGEENMGWYIGTTTLDFERSNIGTVVGHMHTLRSLSKYVAEHRDDGRTTVAWDRAVRMELVDRYVEARVGRLMSYRVISMQAQGRVPNYEASMTKLYSSELTQRIAGTGVKLLGLYGQISSSRSKHAAMKARPTKQYLYGVAITIGGGTSEIQRNIVAGRGLGLPHD
ncbi:MAG: acyl-CoA dehydrogenase family protein [Dehalococcoidia bacterium]|nr:acyl-CoA dehydrogenase family protein [Dehalococcoidia bacterium]